MANQKIFLIQKIDELQNVAEFLLDYFLPSTLFLLDGEMSSGKTTLVADILKLKNFYEVSSPTYAFHNEYILNSNQKVHHIDLHRTENSDDLETLGLWDLFEQNPQDLFFIEWGSRINVADLPMNFKVVQIKINIKNMNQRELIITY
jgi:tRNA threonylcarbamoyl adenosine modification protein YjeE